LVVVATWGAKLAGPLFSGAAVEPTALRQQRYAGEAGRTAGLAGGRSPPNLPAMKPLVIIVPLVLILGGIAQFYLLPTLPLGIRVFMMVSEFVSAGVIGLVLWRRLR